jgi:hypothetical protein
MTKAALDDCNAVIGRHVARKAARATAAGGLVKSASRRTFETLFATQRLRA